MKLILKQLFGFQIGKGVHQGYVLSPCLFNLYAEYITRNARLDESKARIKIPGRNINHLVKAMFFPVVMYGYVSWTKRKLSTEELMLLNCGVGEDS